MIQAWDFRPGENFIYKMQQVTKDAERTIAVVSPSYLNADFTQPEWAVSFKRDPKGTFGYLLPVIVRDCGEELAGLWPQIIYINLVDLDEQEARKALIEGINQDRNKPGVPPLFPGPIKHSESEEPEFPGRAVNIFSKKSSEEKLGLPKLKLNKPFDPYRTRDEWVEYITENLQRAIEGEDLLNFYAGDAQGYRQIRISSGQKPVYSLDIHKGSMGGSRRDDGISFAYAEGRAILGSGFHASGHFKWDRQKEAVVLELLDFSLLANLGGTKEYTKEEFLKLYGIRSE